MLAKMNEGTVIETWRNIWGCGTSSKTQFDFWRQTQSNMATIKKHRQSALSCVSMLPWEAGESNWKAVRKEKDANADMEETGIKGWRKRGVYPWVSVFPGPVNQSSALFSLQLHLANEKHRRSTLTATPLRAERRDRGSARGRWGEESTTLAKMNANHRGHARSITEHVCFQ